MKPLIVLLFTFFTFLFTDHLLIASWDYELAGNSAMAAMLLFTALGHFMYKKGMTMMIPEFIPAREILVFLTGFMEICFAILLCIPDTRRLCSIFLVVFFLLVLPANIYAARKRIDYQNATYGGKGIDYLWIRIPMQLFFIAWVLWFGLEYS